MPKFRKGIVYSGMSVGFKGEPREIQSPAKIKIPDMFPGLSHDWVDVKALWDTGATNSVVFKDLALRLKLPAVGRATTVGIHGPKDVDVFTVDILLMERVLFSTWRVSAGNTGPTSPGIIIGMDIITKGDTSFMASEPGYLFSFLVPSAKQPCDFAAEVNRFNQEQLHKAEMAKFVKRQRKR